MKHEIDRDHMGRFAVGNGGGPGRPKRQAEEDYLQTLSERVPLALWAEIVDKAASDAAAGDAKVLVSVDSSTWQVRMIRSWVVEARALVPWSATTRIGMAL